MERQRKSRSRAEWQQLISTFEQNEMSRKDFCTQHDLSASSFEKWYYRLREINAVKLVPIISSTSSAIGAEDTGQSNIQAASTQAFTSQLCATFEKGIRLEFDSGLCPDYLKQIINAIHTC